MTIREKIALLEEMLEMDENSLQEDTILEDIEDYDSMAKLSLIVLMEDEFSVKLSGEQIKGFNSIKDIIALMN